MSDPILKTGYRRNVKTAGELVEEILTQNDCLDIGMARANIKESQMHYHKKTTEYYYIISGKGAVVIAKPKNNRRDVFASFRIDGVYHLVEGDALVIPPRIGHYAVSDVDNFNVLVVSTPAWNKKDHHLLTESKRDKNVYNQNL